MAYFTMSKMVLKWAFKKPATRNYPAVPRQPIPLSRGQLLFNPATCTYCSVCGKKCPTSAIVVGRNPKKWTLDRLRCINCGYCVELCPKKSLELETGHGQPVVTKDKETHLGPANPAPKPAAKPATAGATPGSELGAQH
jgi:formate hydrogenlyase subunit 6/NADH:ubiquinone oxidoreductase subunit I